MHTLTRVQKSPRGKFSRNTFTPKRKSIADARIAKREFNCVPKNCIAALVSFCDFSFGGGGGL